MTIAFISSALRSAFYGILTDKFGRKTILLFVYLMPIIYFSIYFFSTDYTVFLLAAVIAGTGAVGGQGQDSGAGRDLGQPGKADGSHRGGAPRPGREIRGRPSDGDPTGRRGLERGGSHRRNQMYAHPTG